MISKLTKILSPVAAICIGIAQAWQHYSRAEYEKSVPPRIIYNLDIKTDKLQTNKPAAPFQRLRDALGVIGMLAALFALPLLVKDITQRQQHN
jgi:hypothetical protein